MSSAPSVEYGNATRLSATGLSTITSGNAQLIGVLFTGTGTGTVQLYHGVTASVSVCGIIRAYTTVTGATVNQAVFFRVPAYCSGGITANVGASADPDITLYWNPAGG
jgi:hypothetical protein